MNGSVTMADLKPGTRIRHFGWDCEATVKDEGGTLVARWDDLLSADEISPEGPVFPEDIEIIGDAS